MTTKVKQLRPNVIDGLKPGDAVSEIGTPGLIAVGNKDTTVSWRFLRKTKSGKVFKATLGSAATFSIIEAKEWAKEFNDTIERGEHPAAKAAAAAEVSAAEEARLAMTVDRAWSLYKAWVETRVEAGDMSPGTLRMKCSRFKVDIIPAIGSKPITDVTTADLEEIVNAKIRKGFGASVNHLARELGAFFDWIRRKGKPYTGGLPIDPTDDLETTPAEKRIKTRFFDEDEISLYLRALAEDNMKPLVRRIYLMLLLSGQRLDNVLRAQTFDWKEHREAWEIPAQRTSDEGSQTKAGPAYVIPLGPWGQAIFAGGNETWVFPSPKKNSTGPRCGSIKDSYEDIRSRMQRLAPKRMHIRPWSPHDFRRTIRTHMAELEVEDHICEAVLGHAVSGIRRVYDQYKYVRQKRAALKLWEDKVRKIAIKAGVADRLGIPSAMRTDATPPVRLAA